MTRHRCAIQFRPGGPLPSRTRLRGPWRLFVLSLAANALAVSCAYSDGGGPSEITGAELAGHVEALAADSMEGRAAASPGYHRAAEYASSSLQAAGVLPGWPNEKGDPSFLGPVPLLRYRVGPGTALDLRWDGEAEEVPHGERSLELMFLPRPEPDAGEFAPPAFVGFAHSDPEAGWDDLRGLDLEGRVAIMMSGFPSPDVVSGLDRPLGPDPSAGNMAEQAKLDRLAAAGAQAVLAIPNGWIRENWDSFWALQKSIGVVPVERYELAGGLTEPTLPILLVHPDLVDRLFPDQEFHPISHAGSYGTFELAGLDARLRLDVERVESTSPNVVGLVPGTDPELNQEYVLVSAHLDGQGRDGALIFNSANDDASGCAAVLEVAEAIAADPLPRSVLFVLFTAEEGGHWGSLHFLAHSPFSADAIVAAINVEQVGRVTPFMEGFAATATSALFPAVRKARDATGIRLALDSVEEQLQVIMGTDALSFVQAGLPTVFLGGGESPEYHTPGDRAELIDPDHLLEAAGFLHALVRELGGGGGDDGGTR